MNKFLKSIQNETKTLNGAITYKSTMNACLDLYSGGVTDPNKGQLIREAMKEDVLTAAAIVMYLRDVRGGQGNRDILQAFFAIIQSDFPKLKLYKILKHIPEIGSFKDLVKLYGSSNNKVKKGILKVFHKEMEKGNRLAFKWFPRKGRIFNDYCKQYKHSYRELRKKLVKGTEVVETDMCKQRWHQISYSKVPSLALKKYKKAFIRHDKSRFSSFIKQVNQGKQKVNASVLYPHDIVSELIRYIYSVSLPQSVDVMEAQWKNLPNFMEGSEKLNILPVCDVSGSMYNGLSRVRPIDIAVGLSIYFSERNEGGFKDYIMSFSKTPSLHNISVDEDEGYPLLSRIKKLSDIDWGMNTNLQAMFDTILKHTMQIEDKKDVPDILLIVSDMEFDSCTNVHLTNYEEVKRKYDQAGVDMPLLVFWRVNTKLSQQPLTMNDYGIIINGYSPSVMKIILSMDLDELKEITPYKMMLKTIQDERYGFVRKLVD